MNKKNISEIEVVKILVAKNGKLRFILNIIVLCPLIFFEGLDHLSGSTFFL